MFSSCPLIPKQLVVQLTPLLNTDLKAALHPVGQHSVTNYTRLHPIHPIISFLDTPESSRARGCQGIPSTTAGTVGGRALQCVGQICLEVVVLPVVVIVMHDDCDFKMWLLVAFRALLLQLLQQ